jgi:hypothetical protein
LFSDFVTVPSDHVNLVCDQIYHRFASAPSFFRHLAHREYGYVQIKVCLGSRFPKSSYFNDLQVKYKFFYEFVCIFDAFKNKHLPVLQNSFRLNFTLSYQNSMRHLPYAGELRIFLASLSSVNVASNNIFMVVRCERK